MSVCKRADPNAHHPITFLLNKDANILLMLSPMVLNGVGGLFCVDRQ